MTEDPLAYKDVYELFEAVRAYELSPGESLVPVNSLLSDVLGYATADGKGPSQRWVMPLKQAKDSARARGTPEAFRIADLLTSYMGRKQLLEELRLGTLEYGIVRVVMHVEPEVPKGPVQCYIPGL